MAPETTHDAAKARAIAVYNAAADRFDDPANSFWGRFGQRTVERLSLPRGARVLDLCCGSGASALPAARAVGPEGSVLGIDLAGNLLELARRKARAQGLDNVTFAQGDLLDPAVAPGRFDAVICVFGIFFVPDMTAAAGALWDRVRPGGRLAVTTWGRGTFEPMNTAFWDAVRTVRPDLYKSFNPWDRISEPRALAELLESGGAERVEATAEAGSHPVPAPADWWATVLGTGYRGTLDQLDESAREQVRAANEAFMRREGVTTIRTDVVYGVAAKS